MSGLPGGDRSGAVPGDVHREGVRGQAGSALPYLEARLDVDEIPGFLDPAAAHRIGDEFADIQILYRGGPRHHRVRDRVPSLLAEPHLVRPAVDGGRAYLRAVGLDGTFVVEPDHQLSAVGLAAGGRRLIEPDVVGDVVGASTGLGRGPAGGHGSR